MAYSKEVVDRFEKVLKNPKDFAVGKFDPQAPNVATAMVGAPACGDVMKLQLRLNDEGIINGVKFKTYGCGSAIASSSLFVDMLQGKTIEEAKQITNKEIAEALSLPAIKLHCSILAEEGIRKAIEDWEGKLQKESIISKMPKREITTAHRVEWQDHVANIVRAIDLHQRKLVKSQDSSHQLKQIVLLQQWLHNQKSFIIGKEEEGK